MEFRITEHGSVDSTSERAFAALEQGTARHGDVHLAHSQSAGRGRLGRQWSSPPGAGLYVSLVLMPSQPLIPPALTLAGALALRDALGRLGLDGVGIEWPNDLMVGAAKLAGLLIETRGAPTGTQSYVLGFGLNLGQREFPRALTDEREVTSLALLGLEVGRDSALEALLATLPERLSQASGDHERLERDYLEATGLLGRRVRAATTREELCGELLAFSLTRGLEIAAEGGARRLPVEFTRSLSLDQSP